MDNHPLIPVILKNGTRCRMAATTLDVFLANHLVDQFQRSDGWAKAGRAPMRRPGSPLRYGGPERRRNPGSGANSTV